MAEKIANVEIVLYEEERGQKTAQHKVRAVIFTDSSARTIEVLDPILRSAYGLSSGAHLRSRREDWDTRSRCVRFSVGDLTRKRHFVVEFSGPMPEWSECDW